MTTLPLFVAASKSMLSTPIPALPITFNLFDFSIIFLLGLVADLTTNPSQVSNSLMRSFSSKPVLTTVSIPLSLNILTASSLSLSAINTLNIYLLTTVYAQSNQGNKFSISELSTVEPPQILKPGGAVLYELIS